VAALRQVIPPDLTPADISAQLGAAWIGPDDVQAFLREILEDSTVTFTIALFTGSFVAGSVTESHM
jgi:N12 class adenine-specific DNA methylase